MGASSHCVLFVIVSSLLTAFSLIFRLFRLPIKLSRFAVRFRSNFLIVSVLVGVFVVVVTVVVEGPFEFSSITKLLSSSFSCATVESLSRLLLRDVL